MTLLNMNIPEVFRKDEVSDLARISQERPVRTTAFCTKSVHEMCLWPSLYFA